MSLGIGVMIGMMTNDTASVVAFSEMVGKTISALVCDEDALRFTMDDGGMYRLFDDGQSCCEDRYMSTDDDLAAFVGSVMEGAEVREGDEEIENEFGEVHETAFLLVTTSFGVFTVVTHNEHNGHYGGFLLKAADDSPAPDDHP